MILIQDNGEVQWQSVIGSPVFSSPAPFYAGYIVASVNTYVYAFSHGGQKVISVHRHHIHDCLNTLLLLAQCVHYVGQKFTTSNFISQHAIY